MTFSIIGFDPLKNRFGVAVSSCHIAVLKGKLILI